MNHSLRLQLLQGMARAFFASAWADQCDDEGYAAKLSGKDIMDLLPTETDPAATHAAETLAFDLERVNQKSLELLYEQNKGTTDCPNTWGHYAAMQAMGHGVGLTDYEIYDTDVRVPYVEFGNHSLQKDYDFSGL